MEVDVRNLGVDVLEDAIARVQPVLEALDVAFVHFCTESGEISIYIEDVLIIYLRCGFAGIQ